MRDYEAEARSQGWVPEEEFTGDKPPAEFVDAQTFVERGEKIAGKQKAKAERLASENKTLEQRIADLERGNSEFRQYHEKQIANERRERDRLIEELKAKRAQAVEDGDGKKFDEYDSQLDDLRGNSSGPDPLAQAWLEENSWYNTNPKLRAFADGVADQVIREGYKDRAYFNEITRRTEEAFPADFDSPTPPTVESGRGSQASQPKPKSYEALPAEARAACDRFVRTIPGFTKEEYLAAYDWDESDD